MIEKRPGGRESLDREVDVETLEIEGETEVALTEVDAGDGLARISDPTATIILCREILVQMLPVCRNKKSIK